MSERTLEELLNSPNYTKNEQLKMKCLESLLDNIEVAGGDSAYMKLQIEAGLTVMELIDIIAPNKIMFCSVDW